MYPYPGNRSSDAQPPSYLHAIDLDHEREPATRLEGLLLKERGGGTRSFPHSERHLQCVWSDDRLRPAGLHSIEGEQVQVDTPGVWNLGAGPDFRLATLRIGPAGRRVTGDLELHVHPRDWLAHGHTQDPRYAGVVAHVTYFPGRVPDQQLPPGAVQIALKDALAAEPRFSFDEIDVAAYPYAARDPETPCAERLRTLPADTTIALLEAAGLARVRAKAVRYAARLCNCEPDELLYQELLGALGYRRNRLPFRRLSERLPLSLLRDAAEGDVTRGYALLLGTAGLLPATIPPDWDAESRDLVRRLWDIWWKHGARFKTRALPESAWSLHALRPANHPARRLAAAAGLFVGTTALLDHLAGDPATDPAAWARHALRLLRIAPGSNPTDAGASVHTCGPTAAAPHVPILHYWQRRFAVGGKLLHKPTALLGQARAAAILVNVLVPYLAARGNQAVLATAFLAGLPPETENRIVRQTAFQLLGRDHNPAVHGTALRRQGLVQIFHDFCLGDRTRCHDCELARVLEAQSACVLRGQPS